MKKEIKVLLVENLDRNNSVKKHFDEKCTIVEARTGVEAQTILSGSSFDIILLELKLPDAVGIDALSGVKKFSHNLPIVLLLDESEDEIGLEAIGHGADDYIFKNDSLNSHLLHRVIRYAIERKRNHLKLQESEASLKLAQDIAKLAYWTWYPERDVFQPSDSLLRILEIDDSDIKTIPAFLQNVIPEDRKKIADTIRLNQSRLETINLEFRVLTKSGNVKHILFRGEIQDGEGQPEPVYYGTGQDITSIKTTRENLSQRERFLEMTGKTASLGGWEIDLKTDRVFWTKAMYDIHNLPPSTEPSRETAIGFYNSEDQEEIRKMLTNAVESNSKFVYERKIKVKNGQEKWVYCTGMPVYNGDTPVKMSGIMQDVTHSRNQIEALRLRAMMLDNVGEAVIAVDKNWRIIFWNKAAEKLFKYKKSEVMGKTTRELQLSDVSEATVREILSLLKKGEGSSGEYTMIDKYERHFPVYGSSSPILDETGSVVGLIISCRDISQDKAATQRILESEERFRKLFDYSPLGKALTDLKTGKWLDSNKTFLKLTGYSKKELKKLTFADITPPEYREVDKKGMKDISKSGKFGPYKKEYIRKDGSRISVLLTGFVIETDAGKQAWTHILDLTELSEKTEALNQSEERFLEYVENASDVFLSVGKGGEITYISPNIKGMLGYEPKELTGKSMFDFLHPEEKTDMENMIVENQSYSNSELRGTYRLRHKDGHYKYIQGQASMRRLENGEFYSLIIARDIDRERKTELQVREQNRNLKDIAFIQSHIVRRPLSNILGLLQINQMNSDMPDSALRIVDLIKKEAGIMDQIIGEIVDKSTALTNLPNYDE